MILRRRHSISFSALAALAVGCSAAPTGPSSTEGSAPAAAAPAPVVAAGAPSLSDWGKAMAKTPAPQIGCFHASYPSTVWEQVACATAPTEPRRISESVLSARSTHAESGGSRGSQLTPDTVSGGNDDNAAVSGLIASATGSFPSEVGGANESDSNGNTNQGANSYSLQMNTNIFASPACNGQAGCTGWEQLVYDPLKQQSYIEFSLVGYSGSCPSPFTSSYTAGSLQVCYFNSSPTTVPAVAASNLTTISMQGSTGSVGGVATDTLTMIVGGEAYANPQKSVLGLANGWTNAEFNVLGENNGSQAVFNGSTTVDVEVTTETTSGSTAAPACPTGVPSWATVESNTMNIIDSCCAFGGATPGIRFTESNVTGATPDFFCPVAPHCTYSFSCGGAGEVSVTCTGDTNYPSDPIKIYQVNGSSRTQVGSWASSATYTTPEQMAVVPTLSTGLASETFVGCAESEWGGEVCDPVPTTVTTPSCMGVACGAAGYLYDAQGQCTYVGAPCSGGVINTQGVCTGVGSVCGTNEIIMNDGTCEVIGSDCAMNGDAPGVWSSTGQCFPQNITCPPGESVAGPPGGEYCYASGSSSGSGGASTSGSSSGGSSSSGSGGIHVGGSGGSSSGTFGGGSSGAGCPKCPKIQ